MLDSFKCLCGIHDTRLQSVKTPQGLLVYLTCGRCHYVGEGILIDSNENLSASAVQGMLGEQNGHQTLRPL